MTMDLTALQQTLREFAAERDWKQFHTPKNLAMALMIESAELAEIFQWMTPEESQAAHGDAVIKERIADEVADVLLYLLQLADHSAIDLKRAVGRKLLKNARKHPPTRPGLPSGPLARLESRTHVLVDWENVQPKEDDIRALVPDVTHVWIFHGKTQKNVGANQTSFGKELTLVPITRSGKNSLDFHLSFYMGYLPARYPEDHFVVISNDQGYGPMLEHAKELGFDATQVGFGGRQTASKRAPARKTAVKAAPAAKAAAARTPPARRRAAPAEVPDGAGAPATEAVLAPAPAPARRTSRKTAEPAAAKPVPAATAKKAAARPAAAKKTPTRSAAARSTPDDAGKAYAHVLASMKKNRNKPHRVARLRAMVKSLLDGGKGDDDAAERMLERMVMDGHVTIDGKGAVSWRE